MKESRDIAEAMAGYWRAMSAGTLDGADDIISSNDAALVVGTGPGEGREGPAAWRQGFRDTIEQMPGVQVEPGPSPRAYEENGAGWLVDEPTWVLPGGFRIPTRVTTVWRQEDGAWRVIHLHLSIGVPDEMIGKVAGGKEP
jgi:ketosteroid isomerase-like protein